MSHGVALMSHGSNMTIVCHIVIYCHVNVTYCHVWWQIVTLLSQDVALMSHTLSHMMAGCHINVTRLIWCHIIAVYVSWLFLIEC